MLILNDLHIGTRRAGGTTPASVEAMRDYNLGRLKEVLDSSSECHLLVAGDLFDSFEVDTRDLLSAFNLLNAWVGPEKTLTLQAGNHDWSPRGVKVSSFQALAEVLRSTYPERVQLIGIGESDFVAPGVFAIAHHQNQDLFDMALSKVPDGVSHLILHANFDCPFSEGSDHSLNVNNEQVESLVSRGMTLVFAHEHQARVAKGGRVVVMGNQVAWSVSDCLGNSHKYAHILDVHGITKVETWREDGSFVLADWQDLADVDGQFVRVTGNASAAQASDVVNAIAAFRQRSDAFVVTNAVRVEGIAEIDELPEQFEVAKAFDVLNFIRDQLDPSEVDTVNSLLKD